MVDDRDRPVVQIFANSEAALVRMRQTAEMAECRPVSVLPLEPEGDPAARAVAGAAILIELDDEAAGEAALPLLDWLRHEAERGARRGVVSVPHSLIDLAAARAAHPDIELLCEADDDEREAAVRRAAAPRTTRVEDSRRQPRFPILPAREGRLAPPDPAQARADAAWIRLTIRARRLRSQFLPAGLFADPVWDMLLDLMAARLEGKQVAVSSLCIAAAVPPTTALRWIGVMTASNMVVRVADPEDGRRVYIELAEATAAALGACLHEARQLGAPPL